MELTGRAQTKCEVKVMFFLLFNGSAPKTSAGFTFPEQANSHQMHECQQLFEPKEIYFLKPNEVFLCLNETDFNTSQKMNLQVIPSGFGTRPHVLPIAPATDKLCKANIGLN